MKLYTDNEKRVLLNYFIEEGLNCKVEFKDYVESFVLNNGIKFQDKYTTSKNNRLYDELINYQYSSKDYIWDEETGDNAVTFIMSHPKFGISSAKIKALKKLNPDWNHLNKNNENVLFKIKPQKIDIIEELIKDCEIDTSVINNQGKLFFCHLFENYQVRSKDSHDFRIEVVRVEKIMNLVSENESFLSLMKIDKLIEFKENINKTFDFLNKTIYAIAQKEQPDKIFSYEEDKKNNRTYFYEHIEYMNKILNYHIFAKKYENKNNSIKKIKI